MEITVLVVAVGEPTTATVNSLKVLILALSVTFIVKVKFPAVVGMPEIIPVLISNCKPSGSEPVDTSQLYC
jgi:hypothetical protein